MASSREPDSARSGRGLGLGFALDVADQPAALERVLDHNTAAIVAVRALLSGARSARVLGIGSSRHAAGIGAAALELTGVRADVPPAPGAAVPQPVLGPDDILIAVSQSGETPSLVAAARHAQARGCRVVAVTNQPGTLTGIADVALDCAAGRERVIAATKSVTTSVLLLRALAGDVDLNPLTSAIRDVLDAGADRLLGRAHPQHVVAGGLGAEWVAAEVALKFAETGGRLLTGEPLVEHLHGPAAVDVPVLALVEPDDPNTAALRGDVHRVGADPSYDVALPHLDDPASAAILRLVAGQLAALGWSRRAGVDADDARGLSKVTRTA